MPTGTIKSVVLQRGFGFIAESNSDRDLFFHMSSLRGGLEWSEQLVGHRVDYEVEIDSRTGRAKAVEVRPAK